MNDQDLERYGRHILLPEVDYDGQQKLLNSHVLVVGLGGLGSPASIYLASSGIGELTLCDFDKVELSNLQRQIVHTEDMLQINKSHSAKSFISSINSNININVVDKKLSESEFDLYVKKNSVDAILDCSDNFQTRYSVNKVAFKNKIPLISGSAIRFEGQLAIFDFRDNSSACYECLFPNNGEENELRCADHGILAPIVGIIGVMQSLETIKVLLNLNPIKNKLRIFDGKSNEWKTITFKKDKECAICSSSSDQS
ncbi:MAG: HesA/MoeB/ThiF family protein [Bacteroidia bacterium]